MSVIPLLLALGLVIAGCFLAGFVWAVRSGQLDDLTTPSLRVLSDGEDGPTTSVGRVTRISRDSRPEDPGAPATLFAARERSEASRRRDGP